MPSRTRRVLLIGGTIVVALGLTGAVFKFGPLVSYAIANPTYDAPEGAPSVAFLGDSYVEGSLRDSGPRSQWADLISKDQAWDQHDFASGGSGFLTRGRDGSLFIERVPAISALDPEIVIVAGGLNDAVAGFEDGASATLTMLRGELPSAQIVVLSTFSPDGPPSADDIAKSESLKNAAAAIDAEFIDVLDIFTGHSDLIGADGEHPTDDGHKHITESVLAGL